MENNQSSKEHHTFLESVKIVCKKDVAAWIFIAVLFGTFLAIPICMKIWHVENRDHIIDKIIELVVSVLNFLGVLITATGVMLQRTETQNLGSSTENAKKHNKVVNSLITNASLYAKLGTFIFIAGFAVDYIFKLAVLKNGG